MRPGKVRAIAICVFRRQQDDCILVAEGLDPITGQTFYRPLGGTIEFGEYSRQTVEREIREETGAEVYDLRYLATIENVFTYNGEMGHEIVLVYEGRLVDPKLYEQETMDAFEDNGALFRAVWRPLSTFCAEAPLYPTGILELIKQPQHHV